MKAPFPWFGGKSRVASLVWQRFGDVPNYVEPFAGSLAVLLDRPHAPKVETVNDKDALLANFWRAVAADPDAVAQHADWPVNEADLHARHLWLVRAKDGLTDRLMADPDAFDAKIAGWWVWGICQWIGSGWCSGEGPWTEVDGVLTCGNAGRGINRQLPHLGNAGMGINRQRDNIRETMRELQDRLRGVRVACGDWSRVVGPSSTTSMTIRNGMLTGILLDPPYLAEDRATVYSEDCGTVAGEVARWAVDAGYNRLLRIAFCGYEGQFDFPAWDAVPWKAMGGYGSQGDGNGRKNAGREMIWFSPGCLPAKQQSLFDA